MKEQTAMSNGFWSSSRAEVKPGEQVDKEGAEHNVGRDRENVCQAVE